MAEPHPDSLARRAHGLCSARAHAFERRQSQEEEMSARVATGRGRVRARASSGVPRTVRSRVRMPARARPVLKFARVIACTCDLAQVVGNCELASHEIIEIEQSARENREPRLKTMPQHARFDDFCPPNCKRQSPIGSAWRKAAKLAQLAMRHDHTCTLSSSDGVFQRRGREGSALASVTRSADWASFEAFSLIGHWLIQGRTSVEFD